MLIHDVETKYDLFYQKNERKREMKNGSMLEGVDAMRLSIGAGAVAATAARRPLLGAFLGIGSSLLGWENVNKAVADIMLVFKSENLDSVHVCFTTKEKFILIKFYC